MTLGFLHRRTSDHLHLQGRGLGRSAAARLQWWQDQTRWLEPGQQPEVDTIITAARKQPAATTGQISLFDDL